MKNLPKGMAASQIWVPEDKTVKKHDVHQMGWFEPFNTAQIQELAATDNMTLIRRKCDELYQNRRIKEPKFTNDPLVFRLDQEQDPNEQRSSSNQTGVVAFAPNDQQYYICGIYDAQLSYLKPAAKPGHNMYCEGLPTEINSAWMRLCDFNEHDGCLNLFRESGQKGYAMGRIFQGALDNGYLVEALSALTLRPRLVRHLFYTYDMQKSAFTVRLFKHGMWFRVEVDDYVPVSPPPREHHQNHGPICCTSEHFPHVLWPSLVEKAYAKLCTHRVKMTDSSPEDLGGWEAIGGGGRVEDALVMLTGGVAGRFRTRDVSADRLFIYLLEHQIDTLFVCRVNQPACDLYGVRLNPYYPYAVNRAAPWEGRLYVQVFCGAPTVYDGGLQDLNVPYSLLHCPDYPETEAEGFFWCDINDFHLYFDTIIECHLVNTPDSRIPGMPPGRDPVKYFHQDGGQRPGRMPVFTSSGEKLHYFESVHANPGIITRHNCPEFNIEIPGDHDGTEVICSFDQYDNRISMENPTLKAPAEVLLKAYVKVGDTIHGHSNEDLWELAGKSAWFPCNHSMVALHVRRGAKIKVVAEFPDGHVQQCDKSVFRVYCSHPGFLVSAMVATRRHKLGKVEDGETTAAVNWTLVGAVDASLMEYPDRPNEFDPELDGMRKPEQDINKSWQDLKQECSLM
jgi:hypothetical protein